MATKEFSNMMKSIQTLEEGRVPAKEAKNGIIEGEKKRITREEYQRLLNNFEMEGLMSQKGLWNLAKEKIMKERGELPHEEGDVVKEFRAMHEEDFWSSWLRELKKKERQKLRGKNEKRDKRRREGEKEENETEFAKRRCEGFVSVEAFVIFSGDLESCGGLSGRTFWGSLRTCLIVSLRLGWM